MFNKNFVILFFLSYFHFVKFIVFKQFNIPALLERLSLPLSVMGQVVFIYYDTADWYMYI